MSLETRPFQPESAGEEREESGAEEEYLDYERESKRYLHDRNEEILRDYEKIGLLEFVGVMTIDEYEDFINLHPGTRREVEGVYDEEGRSISDLRRVWLLHEDVRAAKSEEVAEIERKSNAYFRQYQEMKTGSLEEAVVSGKAEFLGEFDEDEFTKYLLAHKGMARDKRVKEARGALTRTGS
ncbi:MAG: hypothetical protein ACRD1X_15810 [Vicinamibacteria bacterium]